MDTIMKERTSAETNHTNSPHLKQSVVLVLLYNDLRLHDNATLNQAIELINDYQTQATLHKADYPPTSFESPSLNDNQPNGFDDSAKGDDLLSLDIHQLPSFDMDANTNLDAEMQDTDSVLSQGHLSQGHLLIAYAPLWSDKRRDSQSPVYDYEQMGQARQQFLQESLADLSISLQRLGNGLIYLPITSRPRQPNQVFEALCELIEDNAVTDICVSDTADFNQNQSYQALKIKYPKLDWHHQSTATLFDKSLTLHSTMKEKSDDWGTPTKEGEWPQDLPPIFSQFRKKIEMHHYWLRAEHDLDIESEPDSLPSMPARMVRQNEWFFDLTYFLVDKEDEHLPSGFHGGESYALKHLESYFSSDAPSDYKVTRNTLDDWSHSTKFSAWLANGSLSVKTLLNRLRQYEREVAANDSTYWIWFELLWREYFYWYSALHGSKLFWLKGINNQRLATIKGFNQALLEDWKNGSTGYPIVNACMKQLNTTGYMSNRGRQLVASCLIHELGLDWRYGAAYFEQQLIDYDVASNWGNWQYLAGVGADPRGCRQFNLDKQTHQHDPQGEVIAKWHG
ncbi:MAG: DASH family cryptochrome [Psychrobacter sp.]|nr:DASH family cryptochrome [Psychrobacter sp.]